MTWTFTEKQYCNFVMFIKINKYDFTETSKQISTHRSVKFVFKQITKFYVYFIGKTSLENKMLTNSKKTTTCLLIKQRTSSSTKRDYRKLLIDVMSLTKTTVYL